MRYQHVCIESLGYTLPDELISSDQIGARLGPVYRRPKGPGGRLERMSGIPGGRLWPGGTRPSDKGIESGRKAIEAAGIDAAQIGCLVHGSVCGDQLEPAAA